MSGHQHSAECSCAHEGDFFAFFSPGSLCVSMCWKLTRQGVLVLLLASYVAKEQDIDLGTSLFQAIDLLNVRALNASDVEDSKNPFKVLAVC